MNDVEESSLNPKQVVIVLERVWHEKLRLLAKQERRNVKNMAEQLVIEALKDKEASNE